MKMALSINVALAFVLLVAASLMGVSQAKTVVVGGSEKWRSGFNYTEWAFQTNPLYVNDKLVFKYDPPSESSSAVDLYWLPDLYSYMTCDFSRGKLLADAEKGSGEGFTVALDQWKPYYFASGQGDGLYCKDGMKSLLCHGHVGSNRSSNERNHDYREHTVLIINTTSE